MVDTDNVKSNQELKKLSKNMGDQYVVLLSHPSPPLTMITAHSAIESLEAPDFKRNASTNLICQRAVEHEHSCEAFQNAWPGTIKRRMILLSPVTLDCDHFTPRYRISRSTRF